VTSPSGIALPQNRWDLLGEVRPEPPLAVSVIVSHFEQPRQLALTLTALRAAEPAPDQLQIIVADDGSATPPDLPEGVELVRQENRGFRLAAARNLGAAAATADVLVFLDADTVPEPRFLWEIARLPALAPDVLAVGRRRHADLGRARPASDITAHAVPHRLDEPAWLQDAYRSSRNLLDADDRSYRFVIGAAIACSRRLFDDVGGFDESFDAYGGEDWEWAYRAWLGGAVLAHVPEAVAWHDGPDASARDERDVASKNAEALRLSELIPVAGSRPRGIRPDKVDIAVTPPTAADPAATFVSVDAVIAAVPTAEVASPLELESRHGRFDRVRVVIEIDRPVRVVGSGLSACVARVADEALGGLVALDADGEPLLRIISERARRRARRWGREDLFPTVAEHVAGVEPLDGVVDLEGYLGGWR
jgi:GT2 family glycosyltransferase